MRFLKVNNSIFQLRSTLRNPNARWICPSCRDSMQKRRASSAGAHVGNGSSHSSKPWYITTPIFYVNASPHIGHFYTMLLADVLKRWHQLKGETALLLTGTDEHGMKVQRAAATAFTDPKSFCDRMSKQFKILAESSRVSYDRFIRTTDPDHKEAAEFYWRMLNERGHIYTSQHSGWYSVSDETFYPASAIQSIVDPSNGVKKMVSVESGSEVNWTAEANYHFRMSAFKGRLLEFYERNPDFIKPESLMRNIVHEVSSGLQDLSISRPVERLRWGIRVPDDETQTIYVWIDALINYLTYAGFPFTPGKESSKGWPADVHVIGKDIARFHCIYWPALLMALDIPLPKHILIHAHWTMGQQKMSKSIGNVVNPFFAIDRYGVDAMRYFLIHNGILLYDSPYDNSFIAQRYRKGLEGGLGNLASRVLRGKGWNVQQSVVRQEIGRDERAISHREELEKLRGVVDEQMEQLDSRKALQAIMDIIYATNEYVHQAAPWGMQDDVEKERIIFLAAESLRISAILLQPFMPDKMMLLLNMLGVENEEAKRSFDAARVGADHDYGVPKVDLGKGQDGVLFSRLASYD